MARDLDSAVSPELRSTGVGQGWTDGRAGRGTDAQYGRVLDCPRADLRLWSFGMDRYPLDGRRRVRWYQCRRRAVSGMGENDVP